MRPVSGLQIYRRISRVADAPLEGSGLRYRTASRQPRLGLHRAGVTETPRRDRSRCPGRAGDPAPRPRTRIYTPTRSRGRRTGTPPPRPQHPLPLRAPLPAAARPGPGSALTRGSSARRSGPGGQSTAGSAAAQPRSPPASGCGRSSAPGWSRGGAAEPTRRNPPTPPSPPRQVEGAERRSIPGDVARAARSDPLPPAVRGEPLQNQGLSAPGGGWGCLCVCIIKINKYFLKTVSKLWWKVAATPRPS